MQKDFVLSLTNILVVDWGAAACCCRDCCRGRWGVESISGGDLTNVYSVFSLCLQLPLRPEKDFFPAKNE